MTEMGLNSLEVKDGKQRRRDLREMPEGVSQQRAQN